MNSELIYMNFWHQTFDDGEFYDFSEEAFRLFYFLSNINCQQFGESSVIRVFENESEFKPGASETHFNAIES